jgi:hypothetical protein
MVETFVKRLLILALMAVPCAILKPRVAAAQDADQAATPSATPAGQVHIA